MRGKLASSRTAHFKDRPSTPPEHTLLRILNGDLKGKVGLPSAAHASSCGLMPSNSLNGMMKDLAMPVSVCHLILRRALGLDVTFLHSRRLYWKVFGHGVVLLRNLTGLHHVEEPASGGL